MALDNKKNTLASGEEFRMTFSGAAPSIILLRITLGR